MLIASCIDQSTLSLFTRIVKEHPDSDITIVDRIETEVAEIKYKSVNDKVFDILDKIAIQKLITLEPLPETKSNEPFYKFNSNKGGNKNKRNRRY